MDEQPQDNEAKKEEIRRRLNIARYSNRENIVYSDENDHNPLVLEKCPACSGTGKNCRFVASENAYYTDICEACDGERTTGNLVRQYSSDTAPIEARVNESGWVKCPGCGVGFKTTSHESWSGLRHKTCGQKILIR